MYFLTDKDPGKTIPMIPMDKQTLASWLKEASAFQTNLVELSAFRAGFGKTAVLPGVDGSLDRVLIGTEKAPDDPRATVHLFASLAKSLPKAYTYAAPAAEDFNHEQAALGWGLASYKFNRYMQKKERQQATLYVPGLSVSLTSSVLDAIFLARNLVNTPAGDLTPAGLVGHARKVASSFEADFTVVEGKALEEGFPAIRAVGVGSHLAPALIDLNWGDESHPKLTLVGKGVVFDSGGLDLKSADGMSIMKKDMGGAAISLALAQLIMAEKLPVRLRLLIPAVENAIGPEAYHPGDVIKTRAGKMVEIGNTDAEGRLVLCDALTYAQEEDPDLIIDMATLTGATRVALGQDLPGYWTPSDELAQALDRASKAVADPVWRMPLWLPYTKMLKSDIADLNNIAKGGLGGGITAALYLYEFVKPRENWIHFDLFAWRNDALPGSPKGGEATAMRAAFRFLTDRYQ